MGPAALESWLGSSTASHLTPRSEAYSYCSVSDGEARGMISARTPAAQHPCTTCAAPRTGRTGRTRSKRGGTPVRHDSQETRAQQCQTGRVTAQRSGRQRSRSHAGPHRAPAPLCLCDAGLTTATPLLLCAHLEPHLQQPVAAPAGHQHVGARQARQHAGENRARQPRRANARAARRRQRAAAAQAQ